MTGVQVLSLVAKADYWNMDFGWIMVLLGQILPLLLILVFVGAFLVLFGSLGDFIKFSVPMNSRINQLRRLKKGFSPRQMRMVFVGFFLFGVFLIPSYVAATGVNGSGIGPLTVKASPGATTVILGMPITESITGLTAGTDYNVSYDGEWKFEELEADSDGEIAFTLVVTVEGQAQVIVYTDGSTAVISFYIEGLNIMVYLQPFVQYMVLFMVIGALLGVISGVIHMINRKGGGRRR